ncbi:MAG TPA: Hsp20/alpha crystallin family protein [Polyangiaceae bacterium]
MLLRRVWPSRPTFESPFSDLDQLRSQMQRLFDAVGGSSFSDLGAGVFPPVNITQDNDNFYVRAEVPGLNKDDIEISATGRRLSISGQRKIAKEADGASYHRKERPEGHFNRTVQLPTDFDNERVEARYNAGLLTVTLPKHEAAKPRQIKVTT